MGFRNEILRSQFYMENTEQFNNIWFGYKRPKFLHNIDTFYYTVSIKGDYNKSPDINDLIYELADKKHQFKETKKPVEFNDKLYVVNGRFDDVYEYRLTCPDKYDIFISSYLPNASTPRLIVQLRSSALWIDGVKETIEDSYYQIYKVLGEFGLEIGNVYENRIDYCYHTNYIQDMYRFFNDMKINKEIKTNMRNWRKDGLIFDSGLELNYFALGNRISNNVFIRVYDKTREVCEMAYKGFFIEVWFKEGLISAYDKYCLEYAYRKQNYEKRFEAMLYFYLEYGNDEIHKKEIRHYLEDTDINFNKIKALALSLLPNVTTIVNIEFQTKRKFYYYADEQIEGFNQMLKSCDKLDRLFKIVDNRKVFLNYLTHYNLRFVDTFGEYKSWWKRLRGLKMQILNTGYKFARKYQHDLDKEKILTRSIRDIATNALYNNSVETDFIEDISDFLCSLNDNDMCDISSSAKLFDYAEFKDKKYKSIKNRLCDNEDEENKKKPVKSLEK